MAVNFPLLFFLLLIPLSGFIAWAGDRVGHRIGKRRHTLLGLRPRHTATITTVAAGMLISLVSFGLMWASNATFRAVLRNGTALLDYNRLLRSKNHQLHSEVQEQRELADTMRSDVQAWRQKAEDARQEAEASLFARKLADKALLQAKANLEVAKDQVGEARATLAGARAELTTARASLATTQGRLNEKEQQLANARSKVRKAESRLRVAQARTQEALTAEQVAEHLVENARRTFETVTAEQKRELDERQTELARLAQELAQRREEMERLIGQRRVSTTALRTNRITYEVDEELERAPLSKGMTTEQIQAALRRLLEAAAGEAAGRGAVAGKNGRAVVILPKPMPVARGAGTIPVVDTHGDGIADESDSIAAAAEAIRRANEDVAVLVVASANAVEGEPVPVEFRPYRNRRVLSRGTVLGTLRIDAARSQQAVADTLYTFLRRDVRKQILDSGVIPPLPGGRGSEDDEGIVSISGARWLQVLDEVRRAGDGAQVVVRASADLRAADPVALSFEVVPLRDVPVQD